MQPVQAYPRQIDDATSPLVLGRESHLSTDKLGSLDDTFGAAKYRTAARWAKRLGRLPTRYQSLQGFSLAEYG